MPIDWKALNRTQHLATGTITTGEEKQLKDLEVEEINSCLREALLQMEHVGRLLQMARDRWAADGKVGGWENWDGE